LAEELIAKHGAKKALTMSLAILARTVPSSAASGPPPPQPPLALEPLQLPPRATENLAVVVSSQTAATAVLPLPIPPAPQVADAEPASSPLGAVTAMAASEQEQAPVRSAGVVL
jgi:hypothetical protein